MPKISALPNQTTPDGADELPVNDVSATTTKKMTLTVFKEWLQSLTSWITTAMIGANQVTTAKLFLPRFKAISTSSQTVSNTSGTSTLTTLASLAINQSGFSLSSSTVTILEDGDYMLMAEVRNTDTENFLAYVQRNGTAIHQLSFRGATSTARGYQCCTGGGLNSFTAGDVLRIMYENRSFATSIIYAQMSVVKVG